MHSGMTKPLCAKKPAKLLIFSETAKFFAVFLCFFICQICIGQSECCQVLRVHEVGKLNGEGEHTALSEHGDGDSVAGAVACYLLL